MKKIITKYNGYCKKCENSLYIGTEVMYEKSMGIFCIGCEPKEVEEIRKLRLKKRERKIGQKLNKARRLEGEAKGALKSCEKFTSDIAFNTQPGHIPLRARVIKKEERAFEKINEADRLREVANSLSHVQVKGDAERRREMKRQANSHIEVGDLVHCVVFGKLLVKKVNKKTFTCSSVDRGFKVKVDKSWVKKISI